MKLVPDWKRAHRWMSVQISGAGAAVIATYMLLPEAMRATFTPNELHLLTLLAFVLIIGGRLIDQDHKDADPKP